MVTQALNSSGKSSVYLAHHGKILLVDENPKDLDTCLPVLCAGGFEVRACDSFAQGERFLAYEDFDFVIVDQGSPAFEGQSVVKRALSADRRKPVLVLTRCHDINCYIEAMQLGAVDYLEKPLSGSDLIRLLQTHLPHHILAA